MRILGVTASGFFQGDFELITTEILASATPSVTFNNLATYASTYKHLQVRIAARTDRTSGGGDSIILRINNDSGSNYSRHSLSGDGTTVASFAATSTNLIQVGNIYSASDPSNSFGGVVVDLLDVYSTTKNKTVKSLAASASIILRSGVRLNTEAISTITLQPIIGPNFVIGSRFSIYGIRG